MKSLRLIALALFMLTVILIQSVGQASDEEVQTEQFQLLQNRVEELEEQNRLLKEQVEFWSMQDPICETSSQPGGSSVIRYSNKSVLKTESFEPKGKRYSVIQIPWNLTLNTIQQAITKAGLARKWEVQSSTDNWVVLHLKHRKYDSTLYFNYNSERIVIYSDSYLIKTKKPKNPDGWIKNLEQDITKILKSRF